MVLTDILTDHSHQVLHVSFSHNGKMFATCSKDGFVIVSIFLYLLLNLIDHTDVIRIQKKIKNKKKSKIENKIKSTFL